MFNLESGTIQQSEEGWIPCYVDKESRLGVMSIGFLLNSKSDAVIWRGPKKNCTPKLKLFPVFFIVFIEVSLILVFKAMIKKFMNEVCWGDLDFLLIDTPPGTSDEHLAVMENIREMNFLDYSAILVTTPQVCILKLDLVVF